ncbi:hypothetical protein BDW60DRAFT_218772 [Aspergillus nidulans var. acristatus]
MALPAWNILRGKTAAITGGTTGIGRAIALEYIRQGCHGAINHLSLQNREQALEKSLEIAGDVADPKTSTALIDEAVKRWGKLDASVANAGMRHHSDSLRIEPDLLNHSLDVNEKGTFYSCQSAAHQMVKQGHGGCIIAISSVSALVGGVLQTHYTPAKAAIRCNALLPGTINTQLADHDMKNPANKADLEARIPLGRFGEPEDMAGPAVFLASKEMSRLFLCLQQWS